MTAGDELRVLRARVADAARRLDALVQRAPAGGRALFQITNLGNMPTQAMRYFAAYPVRVTGQEQEGNTDLTFTVDKSAPVYLIALGPVADDTDDEGDGDETEPQSSTSTNGLIAKLPKPGDYVIAREVGGRWAFECPLTKPAGIKVEINNCFPNGTGNHTQVLTIYGSPSGGTFQLIFGGVISGLETIPAATTAPIPYNATAAAVQRALEALNAQVPGNVTCSGGPFPATPVTIALVGELAALDQPLITAFANFTGGDNPFIDLEPTSDNIPPGATVTIVSDETQTVTINGSPTGGSFVLKFKGQPTAAIAWPATAGAVFSALEALEAIGAGNVEVDTNAGPSVFTVTFVGALKAQQQQPLEADASGLSGGNHPSANVAEAFVGGQKIGPVAIDGRTGVGWVLDVPAPATWEVTVSAPNYNDNEQSLHLDPGQGGTVLAQMVPSDGFIISNGAPDPLEAPESASLGGDPSGVSSLSLVRCTKGTATYLGTAGPQTVRWNGFAWTSQTWFVFSSGCGNGLDVYWRFILLQAPAQGGGVSNGPFGAFCESIPGSDEAILQCLPNAEQSEDAGCTFCDCSDGWWQVEMHALNPIFNGNTQVCGTVGGSGLLGVPAFGWTIGGGCFSVTTVQTVNGPMPGYVGTEVPFQIATVWGAPVGAGWGIPAGGAVPCVSASL